MKLRFKVEGGVEVFEVLEILYVINVIEVAVVVMFLKVRSINKYILTLNVERSKLNLYTPTLSLI